MRVLFVCSGNSSYYKVAPFIQSQGDSLVAAGLEVEYFTIEGKGLKNYLHNVPVMKEHLRRHHYDIIHAHYSLCGWVALLASKGMPILVSLMGDDLLGTRDKEGRITFKSRMLVFLAMVLQPLVDAIIVKSEGMLEKVFSKRKSYVIPNGIRLDQFKLAPGGMRKELGLDPAKKYVLFLGDPANENKNHPLAAKAVEQLHQKDVELLVVYKSPHDTVVKYLNSVNAFVLCSYSEGSPNVLKEAMACCCPLVSTQVGDAAWVIGNTPGCAIASYDPADFSKKLEAVLKFSMEQGRTPGRQRILELGLDAESTAQRIMDIYQDIIAKTQKSTRHVWNFRNH